MHSDQGVTTATYYYWSLVSDVIQQINFWPSSLKPQSRWGRVLLGQQQKRICIWSDSGRTLCMSLTLKKWNYLPIRRRQRCQFVSGPESVIRLDCIRMRFRTNRQPSIYLFIRPLPVQVNSCRYNIFPCIQFAPQIALYPHIHCPSVSSKCSRL